LRSFDIGGVVGHQPYIDPRSLLRGRPDIEPGSLDQGEVLAGIFNQNVSGMDLDNLPRQNSCAVDRGVWPYGNLARRRQLDDGFPACIGDKHIAIEDRSPGWEQVSILS
jgi:hypothetical protein